MNTVTVIYIFIAILFTFLFVYFQYFYKEKKYADRNILAFFRFITILSLLILLVNPNIEQNSITTVKPGLIIAVDNSESIQLNKMDSVVRSLVSKIKQNKDLNKRFRISAFSFGSSLQNNSKFTFQENRTNINQALTELNSLLKKETAAIVFISDGNQTYGNDYIYYRSKQPVYPIIIGDTVQPSDLKIDRVNVNSFSYLNNNFPVEVFIHYSGKEKIKTKFIVEEKNKVIFSKDILFSENKKSEHILFKLPSNSVGKHLYTSRITPFKSEKNQINNTKIFAVEVIDEQSNIGLIYDLLHPDIGMLKRSIETNEQRKVDLIDINSLDSFKKENDVFILYQPNSKFENIFKEITALKKNYFIITGTQTDWNFLNKIQDDFHCNITQSTEKYFPMFNSDFGTFFMEDIGFSEFPPLENLFGTIKFTSSFQTILSNKVNGIDMKTPLLAVYSNREKRNAILFGENIWKWRSTYYIINNSFEPFDQFVNNIIQYLSVHRRKIPIELTYEPFYSANQQVKITVKAYDSNYNFDANAELEFQIKDAENSIPFVLTGSYYEALIPNLKSGNYDFIVKYLKNGKQTEGSFTIGEFSVEQELSYANKNDLNAIANNSNGRSFYPDQDDKLIEVLMKDEKFVSIQKENKIKVSLIDWKWLLGLIILSLALEWFIRKYRGLV